MRATSIDTVVYGRGYGVYVSDAWHSLASVVFSTVPLLFTLCDQTVSLSTFQWYS